MTTQLKGTIIKTPDTSPGLLVADGQQKTFALEGAWKSQVAPAVNMAVDIELDGAGFITCLTARRTPVLVSLGHRSLDPGGTAALFQLHRCGMG